jgi:uncharacterized protein YbjT (DUF2867 family)
VAGVEVVRGDLREPRTLAPATRGVEQVVTTANSIARTLEGEKGLELRAVDERGNAALTEAAAAAGVERFVFVSISTELLRAGTPLAAAKAATEALVRASPMRAVIVRPEMFHEIWLSELVGFDLPGGSATIFGRGRTPHRYIGVDDLAAAIVALVGHGDPPAEVPLAGPDALTRVQVVETFERVSGRDVKVRHVPRAALRVGAAVLRSLDPVKASLMGNALCADDHPTSATDAALRALGIEPRTTLRYLEDLAAQAGRDRASTL